MTINIFRYILFIISIFYVFFIQNQRNSFLFIYLFLCFAFQYTRDMRREVFQYVQDIQLVRFLFLLLY